MTDSSIALAITIYKTTMGSHQYRRMLGFLSDAAIQNGLFMLLQIASWDLYALFNETLKAIGTLGLYNKSMHVQNKYTKGNTMETKWHCYLVLFPLLSNHTIGWQYIGENNKVNGRRFVVIHIVPSRITGINECWGSFNYCDIYDVLMVAAQ